MKGKIYLPIVLISVPKERLEKNPKILICIFLVIFEDTECQGLCGENGTKAKRDHSHIIQALIGERGVKNQIFYTR